MNRYSAPLLAVLLATLCTISNHLRASQEARNQVLLSMPDNTWLNLEPAGMAKARMYSGACFGGGFLWYFGGAHRSYLGNDVELYNPRSNTWIQATEAEIPERGSPNWKALTGGGGSTTNLSPKGRPYTEHTYQQVCWQPKRQRFFVVLLSSGTWEFDPKQVKWIHLLNRFEDRKAEPRGAWAQNHVLYEPAYDAPVLIVATGGEAAMYRFDHDKHRWDQLGPTPQELRWNEFYSTYVPQWRSHLISTMKKCFFRFYVAGRTLTPIESPEALVRCQSLSYDRANKLVLALAGGKVDKYHRTVLPWILDVETQKWQKMNPKGPAPVGQTAAAWATCWYDPEHNVHLLINCVRRDRQRLFDGGVTEVWAYRYRSAAERPGRRRFGASLTPTHPNVRYGPYERDVLDLYLADSAVPAPLVLHIHGGGFRGGDKKSLNPAEAKSFLEAGFSIAAVNYRLTDNAPAPVAYLDCARALQFLRYNASKWNINPKLVASTGGSAGAGTSMWLAFHDDLANPESDDPIARQSTRLACIAVRNGQSSYDPRFAEKIGIPRPNFERHPFFEPFYDIKLDEIDTPRAYGRYERAAPITYLSKDDPPALLTYNYPNEEVTEQTSLGLIVHHPRFGIALKEQMDRLGIECVVQYQDPESGQLIRHAENAQTVTPVEFIRKHLTRAAGRAK